MMNGSKRDTGRLIASGLMLLALFSSIGSFGHAATSLSLPVQNDSLALTVNPDRSVGVGWNTTSSLGTITQNVSSLFTPGYAIHSSSSFSQQSSAVVQTSTIQYQLPPSAGSIFNSISLTATQTGLTGSGSLTITTIPTSTITATFSTSPTLVKVNATAQLQFSESFFAGTPLANQTAFQTVWDRTLGNMTWTESIADQIENATRLFVTVTAFNATLTSIDSASASLKIGFVAVPTQPGTDFVTVLDNILSPFGGTELDSIIRSALGLQTGETLNLTYNGSTHSLTRQSTTTWVS